MKPEEQCNDAHGMLTRLGAVSGGSIRERLSFLLTEFVKDDRPLPTTDQISFARFGPPDYYPTAPWED